MWKWIEQIPEKSWALLLVLVPLLFKDVRHGIVSAAKFCYTMVKLLYQRPFSTQIASINSRITNIETDQQAQKISREEVKIMLDKILAGQKKMDHDISRMKANQRRAAELSGYCTFEMTMDRDWMNASDTLLDMMGVNLMDVKAKGWLNSIHRDDRDQVRKEFREGIEEKRAIATEFRIVKGNICFLVRCTAAVEMIDDRMYYFGIIREITEKDGVH